MKLLNAIADDLGIQPFPAEAEADYIGRVVLSGLSKWMLTACFADTGDASVMAIKSVVAERLSLFGNMEFQDICPILKAEAHQTVCDYIYGTLYHNGAFYHKAYHVFSRPRRLIPFGEASIIQGMQPEETCCFSGLAPIALQSTGESNLSAEFDLPEQSIDEIVKLVWKRSVPVNESTHISEYLKFDKLNTGYYAPKRNDSQPITMGRSAHSGSGYEHYIIKQKEIRRIPDEFVFDSYHEYCRLGIIQSAKPQSVFAEEASDAVRIKLSYKLPKNDLRFFQYIAWPASIAALENPFSFVMHKKVWPTVKKRLLSLNYEVIYQ